MVKTCIYDRFKLGVHNMVNMICVIIITNRLCYYCLMCCYRYFNLTREGASQAISGFYANLR